MSIQKSGQNPNCPDNDLWIRVFEKEASPEQVESLTDHALSCVKCSKKLEVMRALTKEMKGKIPWEVSGTRKNRFLQIPPRFAVAAALILILFTGFIAVSRITNTNIFRDEQANELHLKSPNGSVDIAPALFKWDTLEGAVQYEFRLIDEELNLIYKLTVPIPQLTLTTHIHGLLIPGRTYLWKIEAQDDDSNVLSSGQAYFFIKD